jgi:hypothetical protein
MKFRKKHAVTFAMSVAALASLAAGNAAVAEDARTPQPELQWDASSLTAVYDPPAGFYAYAPSVIREGKTEWIWTCHNHEERVIEDHIYMTKRVDGVVTESRSVLQASPAPAWDSFHACDPSVVAGRFDYGDTVYRYAMFYLGNDLDASAHNQVGVAFATSPAGPWVKYPEPLVTSARVDQWGAGQPTAIAMPGQPGKVLLGYTRGDTSTRAYVSTVDLSDVDGLSVSEPVLLPTAGLTGADGSDDYLNGFDMALTRNAKDVVVVREQHPYPLDNPWWIGPAVQVDLLSLENVLAGMGTWKPLGDIDEALTGFARNHNAGLVRDRSGRLVSPHGVEVVFTDSCSSLPTVDNPDWSQATCDSLYSYDLWSISAEWDRGRGH